MSAASPYAVAFQTKYVLADGTSYPLALNPVGGNVGIGTTNPQHTLHVAGVIGAQEIIVSATGADYVFDPAYHLQPLSDVAAFIHQNHHLPGIPSAADVETNGVRLGDMQSKLLAKVEELTLHMIEANDANTRLRQQNRDLQDRLDRLEAAVAKLTASPDPGPAGQDNH